MIINRKEQPITQSLGASRLYTTEIFKEKKSISISNYSRDPLSKLTALSTPPGSDSPIPNPPFLDLLPPSAEDLC